MVDQKFIGKTFEPVKYTVGVEKIKEYAQAVGETNELYLDEEKAAAGPYGCIVAPPMFAVVYGKQLLANVLFDNELDLNLMMLVHGEQEFEFHRLIKPDEVIYTSGEIIKIQNKENLDIVTLEATSKVGDEKVTTGRYIFVFRR